MQLYPAIDLQAGACVRLQQGCFDRKTIYDTDPIKMALTFKAQGASWLHVVDLDGARAGHSQNLELIEQIAAVSGLKIQTGGGLRTGNQISDLIAKKVTRVIIGSLAVLQPEQTKEYIAQFGVERIVLALDVKTSGFADPMLATAAWQETSQKNLWELLAFYQQINIQHVIVTDIDRDGTLSGPNFDLYRDCVKQFPTIHFQASGGVNSLIDLSQLAKNNLAGAIVGKAIYENKFTVQQALNASLLC